ncbi:hypothetical protein GUJ93_ZPchr0007g3893 [Zizania palustris]|uniref:Uncharacterized protein n=1 Tax=Zizania palustris TaxID=103762 RepID=A0A8J5VYM0_ZIZPA|nr:hypothetical protein GUJ93_ZPchr0007g3893 [Zizania palustris]
MERVAPPTAGEMTAWAAWRRGDGDDDRGDDSRGSVAMKMSAIEGETTARAAWPGKLTCCATGSEQWRVGRNGWRWGINRMS